MGFDTAEISEIRRDAEEWLEATGRVLPRISIPTDGGGQKESWGPPGDDIPCRIAPFSKVRSGSEGGSAGDRVDNREKHWITVPSGTVVTEVDRIEIDGAGTYEITAMPVRTFDQFVMRLEAKEAF